MSNPRYRPREYATAPRDFGHKENIEWVEPTESWTARERSQLTAAQLQHRICFGIQRKWMPSSQTKKITTFAAALGMPYSRLQHILSGHSVLQFEDFGRLYAHIGPQMEVWLLTGKNAHIARGIELAQRRMVEERAR